MADRSQTHFYEVFVTLQDAVALDDRMTLMMAHRHACEGGCSRRRRVPTGPADVADVRRS